jgi:YidC/Oxa1 family membrane protein insertase
MRKKMKKRTKKLLLAVIAASVLFVLTGCGQGTLTGADGNIWDTVVWYFGMAIKHLSFGGSYGIGIIVFTIIIRIILLPLMHFQTKSMRKTQELSAEVKKIQAKYGKDAEGRRKAQEEQQRLYAENNVNPYIGCLPLVVQMPVMMALFQALSRIPELSQGTFLWFNLSEQDPFFILPILAALFTLASSWLNMLASPEQNGMTKTMTFAMPVMIFMFSLGVGSGVALYWVISNAFQVAQTMMINNPFKLRQEREAKAQAKKDAERAKRKAMKKAMKKR